MSHDESSSPSPEPFPATAWTFIEEVQNLSPDQRLAVLNPFIARYWKPVFYFLRVRGHAFHQAEDLTQEFFHRFLKDDDIQDAKRSRGRFRTFLLVVLTRFLSDQSPERAPRQQTFEGQVVSIGSLIGDEERSYEPAANETPEAVFMARWATGLVQSVLGRLKALCEKKGKAAWYAVFIAVHFDPEPDAGRATQVGLGARFGLTRDQVRYALEQVPQWFRGLLRTEVREQVGADADVDAEIGALLDLLRGLRGDVSILDGASEDAGRAVRGGFFVNLRPAPGV